MDPHTAAAGGAADVGASTEVDGRIHEGQPGQMDTRAAWDALDRGDDPTNL
jgi:hypothetical protein